MKGKILWSAFAVLSVFTVSAKDYYVDASDGNDAWDGSCKYEDRDETVTPVKGPKKTFHGPTGVMTLDLQPDDIIHAAAGSYNEYGSARNSLTSRLSITQANLGVVADEGRAVTFIEGASSTEADAVNGCGPDAVRCVYIGGAGSYVRGFTLRNGRTLNKDTGSDKDYNCGGCIYGGIAIDCVITGGDCTRRGCGSRNVIAVGCYFTGNGVSGGTSRYGSYGGTYFNCVFNEASQYPYSFTSYNSTFIGSNGPRAGVHYNGYLEATRGATPKLTNCVLKATSFDGFAEDDDCQLTNGGEMDVNRTPYKTSKLTNRGKNEYYEEAFERLLGATLKSEFGAYDYQLKNPRYSGTSIDIGAVEYNWRGDYKAALSESEFLKVEKESGSIAVVSEPKGVELSGGAALETTWACPSAEYGPEAYSFAATVTGTGLLKVYVDGAAEPAWTVAAADGTVTNEYTAVGHALRFEMTGEDSSCILSDFATTAGNMWFVDVRGNDDWDGSCRYEDRDESASPVKGPKKTLQGSMKIVGLKKNDVVHAASGVYNEGGVLKSSGTSNRVEVVAGVGLVADGGPDVTVIEGAISTDPSAKNGCGPGAVRCVHVNSGAYVRGFTVRNGRTTYLAGTTSADYNGAGVYVWGAVVDCVISNCWAGYRGGAVYCKSDSFPIIRCRISDSRGCDNYAVNGGSLISTRVSGEQVYTGGVLLNTTVWGANIRGGTNLTLYNTLCNKNVSKNGICYRSLIGGAAEDNPDVQLFDGAKINCGEGVMNSWFDGLALKKGTVPVDAGATDYYNTHFPQEWKRFKDGDVLGGQRVYNGKIDLGAAEYDWRGDFAKTLSRKSVDVLAAGANVTTNALTGLDVAAGETLKLRIVCEKTDGTCAVTVTGDPVVTLDGQVLTGAGGVYSFAVTVGQSYELEIAAPKTAPVTVSSVSLPKTGILLLIR